RRPRTSRARSRRRRRQAPPLQRRRVPRAPRRRWRPRARPPAWPRPPHPTPTVPLATSTAVVVVTPQPALAPSTTALDTYMTGVAPQYQYYNGPNATYPPEWYLQRHLGNPAQFTMYRTEPLGLCNTYYYPYQGVYYCYTGGVAAAMPDYVAPGMAVIP